MKRDQSTNFLLDVQPYLLRWGFSFLFFIFVLQCVGCSASSPRFASKEKTGSRSEHEKKKNGHRFSSQEAEEEKKEDDKKVNPNEVATRFKSPKESSTPKKKEETAAPKEGLKEPVVSNGASAPHSIDQQKVMDMILSWLGTPYQLGGDTKDGIDCSGFAKTIFEQTLNVQLPRSTGEQVKIGQSVSKDNLKFGDLLFFNTNGTNPSHVGIYIGDDMFAHASVTAGVTLSSMYSSYYKKRFTEARRVIE